MHVHTCLCTRRIPKSGSGEAAIVDTGMAFAQMKSSCVFFFFSEKNNKKTDDNLFRSTVFFYVL